MAVFKRIKSLPKVLILLVLLAVLVGGLLFYFISSARAAWYDNAFPYRVKVTINHTKVGSSTLTNFPVYVDLSGMPAEFFSNVQSGGGDIRVTKGDGLTEVPREVVSVNAASSTGEMYFKAPTLASSTDTSFYIYYGNGSAVEPAASSTYGSENVWSNYYVGVWHDGTGNDSTSNQKTPNYYGGVSSTAGGPFTKETVFDGVDDYVRIDNSDALYDVSNGSGTTDKPFTVSLWGKLGASGSAIWFQTLDNDNSTDAQIYFYTLSSGKVKVGLYRNAGGDHKLLVTKNPQMSSSSYDRITYTYDGSTNKSGMKLYVNGVQVDLEDSNSKGNLGALLKNNGYAFIATSFHGTRFGTDHATQSQTEMTFAKGIERSADWISTQYNNQNDPATFYTLGAQETHETAPAVTTGTTTAVAYSSATASGDVTKTGGKTVTERGFVYSKTSQSDPGDLSPASSTYAYVKNETGSFGTSTYSLQLSGLSSETMYYLRAYAKNSIGYSYGSEKSFTTDNAPPMVTQHKPFNTVTVATTTPILTFTGTDPEGDDLTYQVQVNGTSIFSGGSGNQYKLTIDHTKVSSNLTNFPVYVDLSTIAGGLTKAQAESIRVYTDKAKTHEVPREIVSKDEMWFKAPSLSSTSDTSFYIDYDGVRSDYADTDAYGAENVWDNHHEVVWHMNTVNTIDSTKNDATGTPHNLTSVDEVAGVLGGGIDFGRVDGYIKAPPAKVNIMGDISISFWFKYAQDGYDGSQQYPIAYWDRPWHQNNWVKLRAKRKNSYNIINIPGSLKYESQTNLFFDDSWHKIDITSDNSVAKIYFDGSMLASSSPITQGVYNSANFYVGAQGRQSGNYTGKLDEVRESNIARNADWIFASYQNQNNPDSFYTVTQVATGPLVDAYSDTDPGFTNTVTTADTDPFNSGEKISYAVQDALATSTTYYWRVRTKDPSGSNTWSDWSSTREFDVATTPGAPENFSAEPKSESAKLTWNTPTSDGGAEITDYEVQYEKTTGGSWVTLHSGTSTTATVTGLSNGTSYDFRVSAVNAMGHSPWSSVLSATPGEPAQVKILGFPDTVAPIIKTKIRITNEGLQSYEYQYSWCVVTQANGDCTGTTIDEGSAAKLIATSTDFDTIATTTVPTPGTYYFHLEADYGSGSSTAHEKFIVTSNTAPTITPDTPWNTVTISTTTPSFTFSGTDTESDNLTYELQVDTSSGFASPLISAKSATDPGFANTVTATDTDPFNSGEKIAYQAQIPLATSTTYYWRVRTKDPGGSDSWSSWSSARSFDVVISRPFIFTVDTTLGSVATDTTFTIPVNSDYLGQYNYNVDCDADGVPDLTNQTASSTCTFASAGTSTIAISGDFPAIDFSAYPITPWNPGDDAEELTDIKQWGTVVWKTMDHAFVGAKNLSVITATDTPDLSQATSTAFMFYYANSLNSNISSWDVSSITDMHRMFDSATAFNQDISSWDVSNVTNMSHLFDSATAFNQDISSWDVSNVTDMSEMFRSTAAFNQDISSWNVSSVIDMSKMFYGADTFNNGGAPLDWGTSTAQVTNMLSMFTNADAFNQDISSWDVSSVVNMYGMFYATDAFNQDISSWDVSSVKFMTSMFSNTKAFNQDISSWDVSSVVNMYGMFSFSDTFNQDLSSWNVSSVTNMSHMFRDANFNNGGVPLDWGTTTANVVNMSNMFFDADAFNQDISSWDVSSVTDMYSMFFSTADFNQDISSWDVSSVADMSYMFYNAATFNQSLGNWDIGSTTNMINMLNFSAISIANYDDTLIGWANGNAPDNLTLGASGLTYCNGAAARQSLTDDDGWTINDNGTDCTGVAPIISAASSSPASVTAGSSTTFSVDWIGEGGGGVKTYVCKTDSYTKGSGCDGGTYAKQDASFSTTSPATLPYTTNAHASGTKSYFVFLEDSTGEVSSSRAGSFMITSLPTEGGENASSTNSLTAHVFVPSEVAISVGGNVNLRPLSMSVNTAVGETTVNVLTNNKTGYQLMVSATSSPALQNTSTGYSFSDYVPAVPGTPGAWSVVGSYMFGFSAFGVHTNTGTWGNDTACTPTANDPGASNLLWRGFSGTTNIQVANSTAMSTSIAGDDTTLCFATEQNGVFAPSGTYHGTIVVTAIAS